MIEVDHVTKLYGKHVAVEDLNFRVDKGEIVGFLGPNGAGKSTTMNIITGYISATEGDCRVAGFDVLEKPEEVKKRIGYLPEFPPLYLDMTVDDYLNFSCDIKGVDKRKRKKDIEAIVDRVKIGEVYRRLIKNLSKGFRQRVGMAQALVGNPEVLILDEPTIGLDPKQVIDIRSTIRELGQDHTVILSSHVLTEVSAVCERILIINKGRIVANDTPENLSRELIGGNALVLRVAGPEKEVVRAISDIGGVDKVEVLEARENDTTELHVEAKKSEDIRKAVFEAMSSENYPILMMRSHDITLEEIFLQVTTEERGRS